MVYDAELWIVNQMVIENWLVCLIFVVWHQQNNMCLLDDLMAIDSEKTRARSTRITMVGFIV